MTDYVSKEELRKFFEGIEITVGRRTSAEAISEVLKAVYNGVMELPTTDAVPVVHGRWIDEHYYSEHKSEHVYRCSECGWHMIAYPDELFHYCPICCARMDAE